VQTRLIRGHCGDSDVFLYLQGAGRSPTGASYTAESLLPTLPLPWPGHTSMIGTPLKGTVSVPTAVRSMRCVVCVTGPCPGAAGQETLSLSGQRPSHGRPWDTQRAQTERSTCSRSHPRAHQECRTRLRHTVRSPGAPGTGAGSRHTAPAGGRQPLRGAQRRPTTAAPADARARRPGRAALAAAAGAGRRHGAAGSVRPPWPRPPGHAAGRAPPLPGLGVPQREGAAAAAGHRLASGRATPSRPAAPRARSRRRWVRPAGGRPTQPGPGCAASRGRLRGSAARPLPPAAPSLGAANPQPPPAAPAARRPRASRGWAPPRLRGRRPPGPAGQDAGSSRAPGPRPAARQRGSRPGR